MTRSLYPCFPRRHGGFTLFELMVVLGIVAILVTIGAPKVGDLRSKANGTGILAGADALIQTHVALANEMGVAKLVSTSPVPAANNTVLDVLYGGRDFVAAAYQPAYDTSGLIPLPKVLAPTTFPGAGSTAGVYTLRGYAVTLLTPDSHTGQVRLVDVPSDIVRSVRAAADIKTAFNPAVAVTDGMVQYTAAVGGYHTLTIEQPM